MSPIWSITKAPRWWMPLIGAGCAALVVAAVVGLAESSGPVPPPNHPEEVPPLGARDGAVHLAGTGTWLPLARVLAREFETLHPGQRVVVHESIGSGGGRRAVADRVIDIGLVSTDPARPRVIGGCRTILIARSAVVYAVHPDVPIRSLTSAEALEIFNGQQARWPDGSSIVPLLRERGDSATRVAARHLEGLGEAIELARHMGRWQTLLTDAATGRALSDTPGSIGLYDLGALRLEFPTLRPLVLDGVEPDLESLADGSWPLTRTLAMIVPEELREPVGDFVDFVRSDAGRAVIRRDGAYLPLGEDGR